MYRILRWLRIIVAIYTLVIAALLGVQCMRLYIAGNSPANIGENGVHITPVYTVDKVCAALRPVAPAALGYAVLVAAALVLIIWGVLNGGMRDVLVKAINICTECIGLG